MPERLATRGAGSGGTYLTVGSGLAEIIEREIPGAKVVVLETAGSKENLARLDAGTADLALVQNGTPGSASIRSIAPLYDEVLHIVVPADSAVDDPLDLRGKRVATGPAGSGTEDVVRRVLEHFGVASEIKPAHLGTMEGIEAFERGEIDAACFVQGLRSPAVERLLASGRARLLTLGNVDQAGSTLEGVRVEFPYVSPAVIPTRSYGTSPPAPVGTIAVRAVLVAARDLDSGLAREITRALFENKVKLAECHKVMARISERFDPSELRFPLHDGAVAYYQRDRPAFFVEYAEAISLGITVAVGVASALVAAREWLRRTKKNRIDVFYLEIEKVSTALAAAPPGADLVELRDRLLDLRRKAFRDLVAETLAADESFTIFQDYLGSELRAVEHAMRERGHGIPGTVVPAGSGSDTLHR